MKPVEIYSNGLIYCSACADAELTSEEVAQSVNALNPTGLAEEWVPSPDATFRNGEPNPCACNTDAARKHWLLTLQGAAA